MISPKDVFEPSATLLAVVSAWEVAIDACILSRNNLQAAGSSRKRSVCVFITQLRDFLKENPNIVSEMREKCPQVDFHAPFEQGDAKLLHLLAERYSSEWRLEHQFTDRKLSWISLTEK